MHRQDLNFVVLGIIAFVVVILLIALIEWVSERGDDR